MPAQRTAHIRCSEMARAPNPNAGKYQLLASPAQLRRWAAAADAQGLSLAAWVRMVCDAAAAEELGSESAPEPRKRVRKRLQA